MVLPNLCFTGDHGVGKRTTLLKFLGNYARGEGVPFHVKTKYLVGKLLNSVSSSNGTEASDSDSDDDSGAAAVPVAAGAPDPDGKYFPFEVSAIHQGYDVARMSLQDKNYIYTIFKNFHGSSYVLSRSNYHFFVFYHAHLLSEESIIFLQEKLEQYSNCLRIFLTSNYPLPLRLADHFVEIPVNGANAPGTQANATPQARDGAPFPNHLYSSLAERFPHMATHKEPQWITWFEKTLALWYNAKWMASDVPAIRQWIYFCLQRNLRWCEMIEYWTLTVQHSKLLTAAQKLELLHILALAEGGGGWQIIPSYRIPLLWESVLLDIIGIFP